MLVYLNLVYSDFRYSLVLFGMRFEGKILFAGIMQEVGSKSHKTIKTLGVFWVFGVFFESVEKFIISKYKKNLAKKFI